MENDKKKFIGKALKKASELLEDEPSEQALLTEYQCSETYISSNASRHWQIASVLWAASLAGLFIITFLVNDIHDPINIPSLTTFMASMTIFILMVYICVILRLRFFRDICLRRMKEIEKKLGMRRRIYFDILENWSKHESNNYWKMLTKEEEANIKKLYVDKGHGAPGPEQTTVIIIINIIIIIMWGFVVVWKWLIFAGYFG